MRPYPVGLGFCACLTIDGAGECVYPDSDKQGQEAFVSGVYANKNKWNAGKDNNENMHPKPVYAAKFYGAMYTFMVFCDFMSG